jgi:hypothetical protein
MQKPLLLLLLTLCCLTGCQKKRESPPCYTGKLLGTTCDAGYLIQVDSVAHAGLGQDLAFRGDAGPALVGAALPQRTYANVIIVYYSQGGSPALYRTLARGQKVYLNLRPATAEMSKFCPTTALKYEAPKFELTDYSGASCPEFLPD